MYICEGCGNCPPPRTSCKRVVTQKVWFHHPERPRAKKGVIILKNGKRKSVWIPDPGGWGYQIVREAKMCPICAAHWERKQKELDALAKASV